MRRLIPILLFTLALPLLAHADLSPGGGTSTFNGVTTNLTAGPGHISITGNSGNGSDQISGVNVNGVMNAASFPGADIGAKVNAAIGALPQGGTVYIPNGQYTFSTTIQCPTSAGGATDNAIDIVGAGRSNETNGSLGTSLVYTGSTDAINQVETSTSLQNRRGCQLRNLSLFGGSAGSAAVGFHFGGTQYTQTDNVSFSQFGGSAIKVENASGMWTERWRFNNTSLWHNATAIWFHADTGADQSVGHGYMNVNMNVLGGTSPQEGILVDGPGTPFLYASTIIVNGNFEGTGTTPTAFINTNNANVASDLIQFNLECGFSSCWRFAAASGSQIWVDVIDNSQGTWSDYAPAGNHLRVTELREDAFIPGHLGTISGSADNLPTVTNGTLQAGSDDSFGVITGVPAGTGPVLTFGTPLATGQTSACTATADGQLYVWATASKTSTSITFDCVVPNTGAVCPINAVMQYHCARIGKAAPNLVAVRTGTVSKK